MKEWTDRVWVCDSEVFAHDTLWVFKRYGTDEKVIYHNDPTSVAAFLETLYQPILLGQNIKGYDQHILRATLLGWTPEQHKALSDYIISGEQGWMFFSPNTAKVNIPPLIDTTQDLMPRKSLKEMEANIGLPIVETTVPFNLDRAWTDAEREEVTRYCVNDVEATEVIFDLRRDYYETKLVLAKFADVPGEDALGLTNAKLVAKALKAEPRQYEPTPYVLPENLKIERIPQQVIDFALSLTSETVTAGKVEIDIAGCPAVIGIGGIHAALPTYSECSTPERAVIIQDVGSYYPSLILNNGYMSRAVDDIGLYQKFYDMRLAAKKAGDKATAEAAKLVLNTTFGAMKEPHNTLYDPIQGISICMSGELYLIDLIVGLAERVPSLTVIQLNTDGWVVSFDMSETEAYQEVLDEWKSRTGLTVDSGVIDAIHQRDVNNYIMRQTDGSVKSKGAIFSAYPHGSFKGNSFSIVGEAVAAELLDGIPAPKTIAECDDLFRFQLVHKAGSTFTHCEWMGADVGKVVRIYATRDKKFGKVVKVNGSKSVTIPNCPPHAVVDKAGEFDIDKLDRGYYTRMARKHIKSFAGLAENQQEERLFDMADPKKSEAAVGTGQGASDSDLKQFDYHPGMGEVATAVNNPRAIFYRKYAELCHKMQNHEGFIFDRAVENIDRSYVDTQQYKVALAAYALEVGIAVEVQTHSLEVGIEEVPTKSGRMHAFKKYGEVVYTDTDTGYTVSHSVIGIAFSNSMHGALSAGTFALRGYIIDNFLLDNGGRGKDEEFNTADDNAKRTFGAPVTAKADVVKAKDYATAEFIDRALSIYKAIIKKDKSYLPELPEKLADETGNARTDIAKRTAVKVMNGLEAKAHELGIEV